MTLAIVIACGACFVGALAYSFVAMRKQVATHKSAVEQLARRGFTVTRSLLGAGGDTLLALDDSGRVALCELGKSGALLVARIAPLAEVSAEPYDVDGKLALRVKYRRKTHEIVFCAQRPQTSDGPDFEEHAAIRTMLAWWHATLSGKLPAAPYRVAHSLLLRVDDAASAAALAEVEAEAGLGPRLPEARLVSERDRSDD